MAQKVIMPKQGLQMSEGTILKWLVKEGEDCKEGEPLFEIETDKLTITIDASATGKLLKIIHGEGDTVPITELIAIIGEAGEDLSSFFTPPYLGIREGNMDAVPLPHEPDDSQVSNTPINKADYKENQQGKAFITPRAKLLALDKNIDYSKITGSGSDGLIVERDITAFEQNKQKATPLAKKIADMENIPASDMQGTGARGKVTKNDVTSAIAQNKETGFRKEKQVPFTGMRKIIAERMLQSQTINAQTTHKVSIDMSQATILRESLKNNNIKISFNDLIAFAVCKALLKYPRVNAELTEQGIIEKGYVNLGIAVALENGLIVPVIKDADKMTLAELSEATKALSQKAKDGELKPDEYKGGSFTISNLGMFGLDEFVAIINPPESGILAVGKIEKKVVVLNDGMVIRPIMSVILSYDHRVVDGAPAAQFLMQVKAYLENPYLLL